MSSPAITKEKDNFRLIKKDEIDYLDQTRGFRQTIKLRPIDLFMTFGRPQVCDNYKVSGEYMFVCQEDNTIISIYDWKTSSLYDSFDPQAMTPWNFWHSITPYDFHIAAPCIERLDSFVEFINAKITSSKEIVNQQGWDSGFLEGEF